MFLVQALAKVTELCSWARHLTQIYRVTLWWTRTPRRGCKNTLKSLSTTQTRIRYRFIGHMAWPDSMLYITVIRIATTNHTLTCPTLQTWRNMLMYACAATIPCKSGVSCIDAMACCGRPDDATSCNRRDDGDSSDLEMRGSREVRTSVSRVRPCVNTWASWDSIWRRKDNHDVKQCIILSWAKHGKQTEVDVLAFGLAPKKALDAAFITHAHFYIDEQNHAALILTSTCYP